ncbi:MAG TPA: hypothetical protein VEI98_10485 [Xanthobacteraceae bacterium]|nr:hypothetical protein [Xanthobacteraceae bacterium]
MYRSFHRGFVAHGARMGANSFALVAAAGYPSCAAAIQFAPKKYRAGADPNDDAGLGWYYR